MNHDWKYGVVSSQEDKRVSFTFSQRVVLTYLLSLDPTSPFAKAPPLTQDPLVV